MGFFSWLMGPSEYDKQMAKKKNRKTIFDSYRSAEDFAADYREEYESWDEALDAWDEHNRKKRH